MKTYLFSHLIVATLALSSCVNAPVDDYQAVTNKLNQALRNQDYARADKIMDEINTDFPGGTDVDARLLQWARIKLSLGQTAEAETFLEQMIFDYPSSAHVTEAITLYKLLKGKHNNELQATNQGAP